MRYYILQKIMKIGTSLFVNGRFAEPTYVYTLKADTARPAVRTRVYDDAIKTFKNL